MQKVQKVITVEYFQKLFSTSNPNNSMDILSSLAPRVFAGVNRELIKPASKEKIKKRFLASKEEVLQYLMVCRLIWDVVGDQVIFEVQGFFETGCFSPELNFTHFNLFPEKTESEEHGGFATNKSVFGVI